MTNRHEEMMRWVRDNIDADPVRLRLKYGGGKIEWLDDALMQIECRHKARKKLAATLQCPNFVFPTYISAEQSTSDELAEFHAGLIEPGARVVDLTAGLGIDAFHLAQRASMVTAIDRDPAVARVLAVNAEALGLTNVEAVCADCRQWLAEQDSDVADVMFIDPARRSSSGERVYRLADCQPDVVAMMPLIGRHCRQLIVKMSPMLDITQALRELTQTAMLWCVGSATECRELVAVCRPMAEEPSGGDSSTAIGVWTPQWRYLFTLAQEASSTATYGPPQEGGWLYEPAPAVMKAGPYKLLSQQFGLDKLAPNTHLYCSAESVNGFPGERLRIERVIPFASSELKRLSKQYPKISVASRNFDYTADWLRAKLRVKDGGRQRLIATTLLGGERVMIVAVPQQ